ncbi:hypothetical protein V8E55_000340 [Tylopilus felleus]
MTSDNAQHVRKPSSILSRLSDRTQSGILGDADAEQKIPRERTEVVAAGHRTSRPRATSFISTRRAQKRDHAAEKWFTDVRELDINVDQPDDLSSLPRKKRLGSRSPKQHEMRPKTDLNALFAPSTVLSAASLRLQTKKELGGDYTSYLLADGNADPYRSPIAYARLVLGRNKHIPLNVQTGALTIVEEAIRGKAPRQVV